MAEDRQQRRSDNQDRERSGSYRGPRREGYSRGGGGFSRNRGNMLAADGIVHVDYKDVNRLRRFTTDLGKIEPRRKTGLSAKHQRSLAIAIKRARHLALMPFVADGVREGRRDRRRRRP